MLLFILGLPLSGIFFFGHISLFFFFVFEHAVVLSLVC